MKVRLTGAAKGRRPSMRPLRIARALMQVVFFAMTPAVFSASFAAVKSIAFAVSVGEPIELTSQVWLLGALLATSLLFGRFFCGNACAFGTMGDLVHGAVWSIPRRFGFKPPRLGPGAGRAWGYARYLVLAAILLACCAGMQAQIFGRSPWDAFGQLMSLEPKWKGYEVGYAILGAIVVGMATVERFFCRFLCPLGAIFSLLPPALVVRVRKVSAAQGKHRACGGCQACSRECPVELALNAEDDPADSASCVRCMRCVDTCHLGKPTLSIACQPVKGTIATIIVTVLEGALLLLAFATLGYTR